MDDHHWAKPQTLPHGVVWADQDRGADEDRCRPYYYFQLRWVCLQSWPNVRGHQGRFSRVNATLRFPTLNPSSSLLAAVFVSKKGKEVSRERKRLRGDYSLLRHSRTLPSTTIDLGDGVPINVYFTFENVEHSVTILHACRTDVWPGF